MSAPQNKQPLFTSVPILATSQFDPPVLTSLRNPGMDPATTIYADTSVNGSLITKITVTATSLIGDNVTTKVIYLGIKDSPSGTITLYQSKIMTGITGLTSSDIVPYVTFEFGGGLVMNPATGYQLYIAASTNRNTSSENGDEINVVVEGGTYDAV